MDPYLSDPRRWEIPRPLRGRTAGASQAALTIGEPYVIDKSISAHMVAFNENESPQEW